MKEKCLPQRKALRLKDYDYSTQGAYFVTFCTHDRKPTLSSIVGAIHESPVGPLPDDTAKVRLAPQGQILERVLLQLPPHLGVTLDCYIIMPNHVHLILLIAEQHERAIRESPLQDSDGGHRSALSVAVGYIKMNAAKEIRRQLEAYPVWQRGYHDHIIRNRVDYEKIAGYIRKNPLRWRYDCFFTE